jgi:hypothetical protein
VDQGTDGESRRRRRVITISDSLSHVGIAIRLVSALLLTIFFIIELRNHAWGVALIIFFGALWFSLSSVASIRRMKRFRSRQNPGAGQTT